MNLQKNIRRVLREEYIPTETEYLGWDIPRKLYDELEDIGIKRWDKENDKVYIAEFQFDTKSVVFEILDSTGEAYFNSLFPIPLSYKSYHTKKIKDLPISIKYFIRRRFEQEWVNIMDKYDDDGKIIQESIRRVLREEDYSPAGKEIIPNSIIVHKSNPMFRDKIMENGLKVRAGECYKIFVGYGVKCKPAIFATNSTNKRAWFDSTYDDDIWFIDTRMIPDVKWYKDRHFESTKKHIVTFQDIPKEAITLHYEGTGSGDVKKWDKDSPNLYESIKKILKEETEGIDSFLDEINSKHNMSDELKDFVKQFIEESDCKRINFSRFKMGVMGLALESGVLINSVALNHPLPFLLFLIFHEVAHQYQFKKYGEDVMYDCYLGEISEREAAEFMKQTEEVADEFAGRKIRQLQKLNLIGQYTPPQMYKNVPIQQITMMVNNYRNDMRRKNIDSPKKVSEYFYNMVKSEL
jgi:hypothetical protein